MVSEYRGTLAITSFQALYFILFRKMQGKFIFISIQGKFLKKVKCWNFNVFQGFWNGFVVWILACCMQVVSGVVLFVW